MIGERCPTCDKAVATQDDYDAPGHEDGCECPRCLSLCWRRWWDDVCIMPGVDWRSRCLAAESERDEAVARAEAAEKERDGSLDGLRSTIDRCMSAEARAERAEAVAQAADLYASEPDGSEHIPDHYDDLLAVLDEWRRTRQSKETT